MRKLRLNVFERGALHEVAEAIYTRLIAKSSKFQPIINDFENNTVSISTLLLIGLGLAGGAAASMAYGEELAGRTGFQFFTSSMAPVVLGGVGGLITYLIFSSLGSALAKFPLYQQVAEVFVFEQKFLNQNRRMQMATAALQWLQRQPEMTFEAVEYLYETTDTISILPKRLRRELEEMRDGTESVLHIRELFERKYKADYLRQGLMSPRELSAYTNRYFIQSRAARNGIRASLIFDTLDAELRDEIATGENWRRTRYTDEHHQVTTIRDNADVTLRYRTGAPHYRWPDDRRESSQGETAPWVLYMGVENPVNIPLWAITVDQVMGKLRDAARWLYEDEELTEEEMDYEVDAILDLLTETDITMFGKWDEKTLRQRSEVALIPEPVLKDLRNDRENPHWVLRWDPNRIDWSQFVGTDGAIRRAFAALLKAIEMADADAEKIVLNRGDALLINNLRTMVRRKELGAQGAPYFDNVLDYPEAWWLNVYYGFRRSEPAAFFGI
ncbi:MAG: hypothetical protein AAFR65_01535 [Pseudomonadota bacterium]